MLQIYMIMIIFAFQIQKKQKVLIQEIQLLLHFLMKLNQENQKKYQLDIINNAEKIKLLDEKL